MSSATEVPAASALAASPPAANAARLLRWNAPLRLRCGQVLAGFELAYQTYGKLNSAGSNAVLVCPALNASHQVAGDDAQGRGAAGWWDSMVGPGKPIDTNLFHVIGVSNIGSCFGSTGPLSPDPSTGQPYGSRFPQVTVQDWVETQALLLRHLGIRRLAAVVGGSLGGMQALQWTISYPDMVEHAVAIASAPCLSAQNIALNEIARQAITSDPSFHSGDYHRHGTIPWRGLKIARMLGHVTYTCAAGLEHRFGRRLKGEELSFERSRPEFEVESYLHHQGGKFAEVFDANAYLLITKALDYFDLAKDHGDGDLAVAFSRTRAKFCLIAFSEDWRFSPERSRELLRALRRAGRSVQYAEIAGPYGHDGFLMGDAAYHATMRSHFAAVFARSLAAIGRPLDA